MTRFRWFPFDANDWRDVSDLLTEVERGVCIELLTVYWLSQPTERIALSLDDWVRRLRLSGSVAKILPATLRKIAAQGLIALAEDGGVISVSVPPLRDEYLKRAKDSDRHGRNVPGTDAGSFQPKPTERSKADDRSVPGSNDGTFQAAAAEGSGGQDKTNQTDTTEQDRQTEQARPAGAGPGVPSDEIEAIVAHYRAFHERSRPGTKERALIKARLTEGYSVADICHAIDGCHLSPHHCGQNDRNTKYQTLELIVRDSTHVDQFIEFAKSSSQGESTPGGTDEYFDASSIAAR